jgi:hypothetical protein
LVRPRRVGVCGTDYHIFEGKHPFLQYPRVMGHEVAVEVLEAPAQARLAPGEICVVNPYLAYNRVVADSSGLSPDALLAKVGASFDIEPSAEAVQPAEPETFGMFVADRWYRLRIRPELVPRADPIGSLDVSLLQEHLLAPISQPRFVEFAENSIQKDAELPNIGDEVYLPELRGELFEGKVEALNANRPVKGLKVGISIPGADYYFNVANTDSRGAFYFNVDTFYSGDEVVFQVFGKNSGEYKISLITPSNLDYSRLDFKTVPLQPSFTEEIRHRSIHNQIENSFFQFRPDSIKTSITSQIFDDKEKEVYLLSARRWPPKRSSSQPESRPVL